LNQLEWLFQSAINQAWLKQCGWNNSPLFSDEKPFLKGTVHLFALL